MDTRQELPLSAAHLRGRPGADQRQGSRAHARACVRAFRCAGALPAQRGLPSIGKGQAGPGKGREGGACIPGSSSTQFGT